MRMWDGYCLFLYLLSEPAQRPEIETQPLPLRLDAGWVDTDV